ncbi:hypothetical protein AB5J72_03360 [Streptomyces sp. CG1]|uniref:hypothetical protein n=1 Tax=Streptomyces sp. CG1 TaxID=1287523 RepID=UPI0034E27829
MSTPCLQSRGTTTGRARPNTTPAAAAEEEVLANLPVPAALRRPGDGSRYRIVKVFHDVRTLTDHLTALGWSA